MKIITHIVYIFKFEILNKLPADVYNLKRYGELHFVWSYVYFYNLPFSYLFKQEYNPTDYQEYKFIKIVKAKCQISYFV